MPPHPGAPEERHAGAAVAGRSGSKVAALGIKRHRRFKGRSDRRREGRVAVDVTGNRLYYYYYDYYYYGMLFPIGPSCHVSYSYFLDLPVCCGGEVVLSCWCVLRA